MFVKSKSIIYSMKDSRQYISNIFKIDEKILHNNQLNYYYTKYPNVCCNVKNLKPYLDNIKPYQYTLLVSQISKLYSDVEYNTFIKKFYEHIETLNNTKDILNVGDNIYLNQLFIYYTQCRPNIKIVTVWNNLSEYNKKICNNKSINVYCYKKFKLTLNAAKNLFFQMNAYNLNPIFKDIKKLDTYCKTLGWTEDKQKFVNIYLLEGSDINFKKEDSYNLHITSSFMEAITLSKVYFNKNSLQFLNMQKLDRVLDFKFRKCKILINTFINYLFRNIDLFDIDKFLILSGSVLYSHGIRQCSDVDFFINHNPKEIKTPNFKKKIENFLLNEETKFFFTDGYTKIIPDLYWREFWEEWHIEWGNMFGANHVLEAVFNPKYHYYYLGLKMIVLDGDIVRRNMRGRPAAIADIIMINNLFNKKIKLNPVPKETLKYNVITKTNKDKFLSIVKYWLHKRYNINITKKELEKIVPFE